mmetsp:Transcript_84524/g.239611  ORF Transcript_84524/g.239611 Transcript_84524/m.239611 type:complete len:258 (-) Transcript_84524:805-1578(-)
MPLSQKPLAVSRSSSAYFSARQQRAHMDLSHCTQRRKAFSDAPIGLLQRPHLRSLCTLMPILEPKSCTPCGHTSSARKLPSYCSARLRAHASRSLQATSLPARETRQFSRPPRSARARSTARGSAPARRARWSSTSHRTSRSTSGIVATAAIARAQSAQAWAPHWMQPWYTALRGFWPSRASHKSQGPDQASPCVRQGIRSWWPRAHQDSSLPLRPWKALRAFAWGSSGGWSGSCWLPGGACCPPPSSSCASSLPGS